MKKKFFTAAIAGFFFLLLPHVSGAQTLGTGAVNPDAPGAKEQPHTTPVLAAYSVDKTDSTAAASGETPRLAPSADEKKEKQAPGSSPAAPPKEN